jgi:hypothetical protein
MKYEEACNILGVSPQASKEETKKAFRTLAKENHPDRGGSEETMKYLNAAYTLLKERPADSVHEGLVDLCEVLVNTCHKLKQQTRNPPDIIEKINKILTSLQEIKVDLKNIQRDIRRRDCMLEELNTIDKALPRKQRSDEAEKIIKKNNLPQLLS